MPRRTTPPASSTALGRHIWLLPLPSCSLASTSSMHEDPVPTIEEDTRGPNPFSPGCPYPRPDLEPSNFIEHPTLALLGRMSYDSTLSLIIKHPLLCGIARQGSAAPATYMRSRPGFPRRGGESIHLRLCRPGGRGRRHALTVSSWLAARPPLFAPISRIRCFSP